MSLPPIESLEDPTEEEIPRKRAKQLKILSSPWSKLEAFLRKELEFLGVAQSMIGLICCFFGLTHIFILNFLKSDHKSLSSFKKAYPIWGGLLFTISGSLLIASERKSIKYLVQGSLVMAILSCVAAGNGISILWSNLEEASIFADDCQEPLNYTPCCGAYFLTETATIVLFLTVLELSIGILLPINKILGKITEKLIAKHHKGHEALYEELPMYYPISEYAEIQQGEPTATAPKYPRTRSRASLHSRLSQSQEL